VHVKDSALLGAPVFAGQVHVDQTYFLWRWVGKQYTLSSQDAALLLLLMTMMVTTILPFYNCCHMLQLTTTRLDGQQNRGHLEGNVWERRFQC